MPVTVLEADPDYVGGISRTASYKGFHFDIGGHRFFSKSKEVEDLWTRDPARRLARAAALVAHLLRRQVLRLPAEGRSRRCSSSASFESRAVHRCPTLKAAAAPDREPEELRGLGPQPVRRAAVLDLLQDLHREGLGHELQRDLRRLGGPADQGAVAWRPPSSNALLARRGASRRTRRGDQDPDRHLPLPAQGPGHDVGGGAPTRSRRRAARSRWAARSTGCRCDAERPASGR